VGEATNVVTDYAAVYGEARSHDPRFIPRIVAAYRRAFEEAARRLPNRDGATAAIEFRSETLYHPFRLPEGSPLVGFARDRMREIGISPQWRIADGGLDANWLVSRGLPTVTFGVGQRKIHTVEEHLEIEEYLTACRLAIALARS
jgi:tripeptide aminopeptidase